MPFCAFSWPLSSCCACHDAQPSQFFVCVCASVGGFADFVDTIDIASFISKNKNKLAHEWTVQDLLIAKGGKGPVELNMNLPASYLLEVFCSGVRHVAIFGPKGPNNVISQSDVMRWLFTLIGGEKCTGVLGALGKLELKELGYVSLTVAHLSSNLSTFSQYNWS